MSAQATSWLSRVTVSTVRRQRYAETTEEMRDWSCWKSETETENDAQTWWSLGQRSNGRSAGAREAPRVLHRQLDRTPHVLHHLRDVVVHISISATAFQHQHVCQHQLSISIPPLTYCRKASSHSPRLDFPLLRPPRRSESPLECPTCPCKRTQIFT